MLIKPDELCFLNGQLEADVNTRLFISLKVIHDEEYFREIPIIANITQLQSALKLYYFKLYLFHIFKY